MNNVINKKIKHRSCYWDNIKGILISLTVFAHFLYQFQGYAFINLTVDYIYMFHMPAFVFVSGYFGKSEKSRSFPTIIRFLFLYFIFNYTIGFIYGNRSVTAPIYSYWYLLAIICWRVTAHRIAKFRHITLVLIAVSLFAGFYSDINNTFAFARIISFYPFYMSGYLLSEEKSRKLIEQKYFRRLIIGLLCAVVVFGVSSLAFIFFRYFDSDFLMDAYVTGYGSFQRAVLFLIAFTAIYILRCIAPNKKIPLLTMFGRNSLWIFLFHRVFTLIVSDYLKDAKTLAILLTALIGTLILCLLFGNDIIADYFNKFADSGTALFSSSDKKNSTTARIAVIVVSSFFILPLLLDVYVPILFPEDEETVSTEETDSISENTSDDILYDVMDDDLKETFDNAVRITYSGDLILLEDQVKRAYTQDGYDFSPVFEYAKDYISSADYAIGVFEGPMAGEEKGYTTSNFDDGKELYLNFPDEFGESVKNAGFDLVTTANNHVLDKDEDGALRTLDVLDRIGLDHTGSYRSEKEKQEKRVKIIECEGIKIAVLSYTYGSNYYDNEQLINGDLAYLTSVISGTQGEQFDELKRRVEQDFEEAKKQNPDLIMVLPHIGTQFLNGIDSEQETWFKIFKDCGADIILGDHPHVVEPTAIDTSYGRNIFTAYCPGNFANIYREQQGDTSALIDVYIDRDTKKVIGGGVIPLYTQSSIDGNFRAIPIYEIEYNEKLRNQLSTDDYERARIAHTTVTEIMLGYPIDISNVQKTYYFNENGYIRAKTGGLMITEEMKEGLLYRTLNKVDSVCFTGDSVTEGTKNGGCGWYEPIGEQFPDKNILNFSKGGCTVSYLIDHVDSIPEADLYVVAIGTNDVRYRDNTLCAMTPEEFVERISTLRKNLTAKSPDAGFIWIAPWYSTDGDPYCELTVAEKTVLNNSYSDALQKYAEQIGDGYINANPYIQTKLTQKPQNEYLIDHIHPNAGKGVIMYSEAVLSYK